jgi:hypothetical protein
MLSGAAIGLDLLGIPWIFLAGAGLAIAVGVRLLWREGLGNQAFGAAVVLMGSIAVVTSFLEGKDAELVDLGMALVLVLSGLLITRD